MPIPLMPVLCSLRIGRGRYYVYFTEVHSLFLTFEWSGGGTMMSISLKSTLCSWHLNGQGEVPWCLFHWSPLSVLDIWMVRGRYHDVYFTEVHSLFLTFEWSGGVTIMSIPVKSALCSWHLHRQEEVSCCLFHWSFFVAVLNNLHGQREVHDVYSTEIHSLFSYQVLPFITPYLDLCLFLNSTLVDSKDHTHSSFSLISIKHANS